MCGALASEVRGARLGEPRGDRPAPPLPRGPRRARAQSFSRAARSACSSGARAARRRRTPSRRAELPRSPSAQRCAAYAHPRTTRALCGQKLVATAFVVAWQLHAGCAACACWLWLVGTCLCRPSQSRSKVQYQVVRPSTPPLWVAGRRARLRHARGWVAAGWTQSLSHTWPGYGHRSVGDQPTNQPTNESAPATEAVPRA